MKNRFLISALVLAILPLGACSVVVEKKAKDHDEYIFDSSGHWKEGDEENREKHSFFSNGECKTCNWKEEYRVFHYMVEDGEASIIDYAGEKETVAIPNIKYRGCDITRINFYIGSPKIKSLKLNPTVRRINMEDNAYIEEITGVNEKLEVDTCGFENCVNFTGFDGPISKFDISSFANTGLTHIEISENSSMTSIPKYAFENSKLVNATFNNIRSVDEGAFSGCSDLKSAVFTLDDESYFSLGYKSFSDCLSLENFTFPTNASSIYLEDECFKNCSSLSSIDLTAETIAPYSYAAGNQFSGCSALSTINSEKIKECAPYMFIDSGIKSLKLSDGVIINHHAFIGGVEEVEVASYGCMGRDGYGDLVPKPFASRAFSSRSLKKVVFGEKLYSTYFNDFLFQYAGIESLIVPNGIETLGEECFSGCSYLSSIVLPSSLKQIKKKCFVDTNWKGFDYQLNKSIHENIEVFYDGSKESWDKVEIESGMGGNGLDSTSKEQLYFDFHDFKMLYYSESEPTDTTLKYWHYVDGVPTAW